MYDKNVWITDKADRTTRKRDNMRLLEVYDKVKHYGWNISLQLHKLIGYDKIEMRRDFLEMIKDCYTPAPDYINAEIEKIKIKE